MLLKSQKVCISLFEFKIVGSGLKNKYVQCLLEAIYHKSRTFSAAGSALASV